MGEAPFFLDGIEIRARRAARAKAFRLSVARGTGEARLTMPQGASRAAALRFLRDHEPWLRAHVAAAPGPVAFRPGAVIPYRGAPHDLRRDPLRRGKIVLEAEGALYIPGPPESFAATLAAWLKLRAREELAQAVARCCAALGRPAPPLMIRDARTRWGSCAANGGLSFSWRLILAPPSVLEYLAAHECAHLVEMNHGPQFWALAARLKPDFAQDESWLKGNGADLRRYGREAPNNA